MGLTDAFWDDSDEVTPIVQRTDGRLYLDVILHIQEDWPDLWNPEAIWNHDDLREIELNFIGNDDRGKLWVIKMLSAVPFWHDAPMHHCVTGRNEKFTTGRDKSPMTLGPTDMCKRTRVRVEDVVWLLKHWRPSVRYTKPWTLQDWGTLMLPLAANAGLHTRDVELLLTAYAEVTEQS
jgi:hypothetical protein